MGSYSQPHVCLCLRHLATARRNYPVTVSGNRRKTGRQFVEEVLRLARGLSELGLRTGDVVAISALNSDLYLEWVLAVAFVGGIAAPLNYRWSLEEARLALEIVRPILLLTDANSNDWHSEFRIDHVPSLKWHVFMDSPIEFKNTGNVLTTEILKKASLSCLSFNYLWAPGGSAMICFTSGTTGKPKGVTISHSALIVQSLAKIAIVGYSEDDVYLHTASLCHIGGISSAMAMLMAGGCHVLIPKFEAKSAIDAIMQHHVTSLITVPAIMADLSSSMRIKKGGKTLQMVKKVLNGGGALSVDLIKDATRIFPEAKLLSAYGMTETCSSLTFMTLYDPTIVKPGQPCKVTSGTSPNLVQLNGSCVGKPAPHVEVKIMVEDSSHVGRILTRGPHVMLGYWGQAASNAYDPSDKDWLDTGDIGHIDDHGNLWLIGRTKGRIKSGGENVYPEEVESIISQHPGILGVVVVGLPDARLTEIVAACIQIRDNWQWADLGSHNSAGNMNMCLSSEILRRFCRRKNLTGFKIPKIYVIRRKPFPLTATGKLRRDQVRREVMSEMHVISSNL